MTWTKFVINSARVYVLIFPGIQACDIGANARSSRLAFTSHFCSHISDSWFSPLSSGSPAGLFLEAILSFTPWSTAFGVSYLWSIGNVKSETWAADGKRRGFRPYRPIAANLSRRRRSAMRAQAKCEAYSQQPSGCSDNYSRSRLHFSPPWR